jgi:hypothetical protein
MSPLSALQAQVDSDGYFAPIRLGIVFPCQTSFDAAESERARNGAGDGGRNLLQVLNHGNARQEVVLKKGDYQALLSCLGAASERVARG